MPPKFSGSQKNGIFKKKKKKKLKKKKKKLLLNDENLFPIANFVFSKEIFSFKNYESSF